MCCCSMRFKSFVIKTTTAIALEPVAKKLAARYLFTSLATLDCLRLHRVAVFLDFYF